MAELNILGVPRLERPSPTTILETDNGYAERRNGKEIWAVCGRYGKHAGCEWEHRVRNVQGAAKALQDHKRPKRPEEATS